MEKNMKDSLLKGKNMERVFINGQMVMYMMALFKWIKGKDSAFICGQIKVFIKENGDLIE